MGRSADASADGSGGKCSLSAAGSAAEAAAWSSAAWNFGHVLPSCEDPHASTGNMRNVSPDVQLLLHQPWTSERTQMPYEVGQSIDVQTRNAAEHFGS